MKTKIQLNKELILLFALAYSLTLILALTGAVSNLQVVRNNECKMPVMTEDNFSTFTHFSFAKENRHQIPLYFLSDIFNIGDAYFSLGDIIIFSSLTLAIALNLLFIFVYFYLKWQKVK